MRILFTTAFLFFVSVNLAQTKRLVGQVVDSVSLQPLPYVNIVLEKEEKGISTDKEGKFSFIVDKVSDTTVLKFSFVGYTSRKITIKELQGKLLKLSPSITGLDEVKLYNVKEKHTKRINDFRIGEIVGLGNFSGGQYPSTVAKYYPKPEGFDNVCFIKQIEIRYFSEEFTIYKETKFRLRILAVNSEGKPGQDLLNQNLIVEKSSNQFKSKINILPYKIAVPENGFFVAVEHLFIEENSYIEEKDYRLNDTLVYKNVKLKKYGPIFKGVLVENTENFNAYFKDTNGWRKMNRLDNSSSLLSGKIPTPAFKITLTD
ncbi:carboxypeptidase-like regulatory domain-containing protein [Zunongwangia sp.]|uniref:carboxypeptidase-like regulatory domain-containing protein n=1 Tax=Zunongwangia sp. TaxID=1965325 RepID=UPI003AA8BCA3